MSSHSSLVNTERETPTLAAALVQFVSCRLPVILCCINCDAKFKSYFLLSSRTRESPAYAPSGTQSEAHSLQSDTRCVRRSTPSWAHPLQHLTRYVLNKQTPNQQLWLSSPKRLYPTKFHPLVLLSCPSMHVRGVCASPRFQVALTHPIPHRLLHSGPKRYDYDAKTNEWVYSHDNVPLHRRLSEEISSTLGQMYHFVNPAHPDS